MNDGHSKHDPREIIRGFQQLLYSPAKCIGFFAGAGTSMSVIDPVSKKPIISGINELTEVVGSRLSDQKDKNYKDAYRLIREELKKENQPSQIEYVLSNVRLKAQV